MARNVAIQILRGVFANMPTLGDGEFYFATDKYQLYVGFNGDSLPVGSTMAVQIQDGTTSNLLKVASDGSISVSLGTAAGKTAVLKTGQLTTAATTANQVVLSYTVTAGKNLFLEYIDLQARLTVVSATASILGTFIIQIGGVTVYTGTFNNPTTSDAGSQSIRFTISEPIPVSAGAVISFLTTPAANTSMLWTANFGGYEK